MPFSSLLPMVHPNDIVLGGWDISGARWRRRRRWGCGWVRRGPVGSAQGLAGREGSGGAESECLCAGMSERRVRLQTPAAVPSLLGHHCPPPAAPQA